MNKMKRLLLALTILTGLASAYWWVKNRDPRVQYEAYLNNHPHHAKREIEEHPAGGEEEGDRPDLAMMQNFLRTMDPELKRPTPELLFELNNKMARFRDGKEKIAKTSAFSLATATQWEERGPKAVGGRTRALLFDPNDATKKRVWAGGVTGGLWRNDDITTENSPWVKVDDLWDNLSISCIASDPVNPLIFYVGTGEFEWSVRGGGVWKTTNGGQTWTRLPSTEGFFEIRDVVVRNENGTGVIYAAVHPGFGSDNPVYMAGLFRSVDGGTTWTQVLPFASLSTNEYTNLPTDIEIGSDNTLWVGAKKHFWVNDANSTIYRSSTGLAGSWSATAVFPGAQQFNGQIELATAPSNLAVVYAVIEQDGAVGGLFKTTDKGANWTALSAPVDADTGIPANDFTRGQAWYDLILAVHPTNANQVTVGGIDVFRSTNGGTSWVQISRWTQGISIVGPVVHADQHEIVYRPGFPEEAVLSNDGGIYYSSNFSAAPAQLSIAKRNLNYNVTQFYTAAIHPSSTHYMLGGTQDNGTRQFTSAGLSDTQEAFGGDGAMCFIDQLTPSIQIVSYVYNDVSLSTNDGSSFPIKLIDDPNTGNFINNGAYDSKQKILFTARDQNSIYRVKNVNLSSRSLDQVAVNLGTIATIMRVSPYTTNQTNLYVGTEAGRVFRITNAQAIPVVTEITGATFPQGSISSIAFGANENQLLVTFSNYGVASVWETTNGGISWVNREGNLPNMPVRWVEYHPLNSKQAYLATELGVWSTDNLDDANPTWASTNGGLANVRTDMLQIRTSDYTLMASTFGRGVFTALIPTELDQSIAFDPLPAKTFGDAPFAVTATATSGLPVSFASSNLSVATVNGSTITIVGAGTTTITATQAGNVQYKEAPALQQTLTVSKAPQQISFGSLTQKSVNDAPFALAATTSSSLTVSYTSSNSNVATVSGNTVTIKGVGTSVITASQLGNSNYLAANDVTQTLTVVSRIIKITGDLAFGNVIVGENQVRSFSIENLGTAPLNVTGFTFPPGYTGTNVVEGSKIIVAVTLAPTDVIEYNGSIIVQSDATSGVNTIATSGTGVKITGDFAHDSKPILFPNPASDHLELRATGIGSFSTLEIVDINGRIMKESVERVSPDIVRMRITHLASGSYQVKIPDGTGFKLERFVKQP